MYGRLCIVWRTGTERGGEDVFPSTEVSFGGAQSARINQQTLELDNTPFAGLAEIFSLAEGVDSASVNDLMAIEPGRVHYHTIQFCSFAHKCVDVVTKPNIVIRKWHFLDNTILYLIILDCRGQRCFQGIGNRRGYYLDHQPVQNTWQHYRCC